MRPDYKPTQYGLFQNAELLSLIESDPAGKEWLDALARQIAATINQKSFGIDGAKELIVASIASGRYIPKFARSLA